MKDIYEKENWWKRFDRLYLDPILAGIALLLAISALVCTILKHSNML